MDPDWIRELVKDKLSFHDAVRVLSDHVLVEVDKSSQERIESSGYSIHGCVHSWIVHVLNQEWDRDLARTAVKFVGLHVPGEQAIRPWLYTSSQFKAMAAPSKIDPAVWYPFQQTGI
jgi:hypothetical protein